jgi:hypothetical protein
MNRQKKEDACEKKHESNNKILQLYKVNVFHKLIKLLFINDISSTHNLLFEVIYFVKNKKESNIFTRR